MRTFENRFEKIGFLFYMSSEKHSWFKTWFDTPYYHTLYCNRNNNEAEAFIENIISYLQPDPGSKFWDLACGKGRHSLTLSKYGYQVVGTDLSEQNIEYASQFENDHLQFYKLDMRSPFRTNYFDYVFNLFTSFGYFEKKTDDIKVFTSVYNSLKPGGTFLFDYINGTKAIKNLVKREEKEINGIRFCITKEYIKGRVHKNIDIRDGEKELHFSESVKLFTRDELMEYAKKVGFSCEKTFGNYQLDGFDEQSSDRLILLFEKK
ncbi:MAG: Methyltransferase type 11 [Bacteroidetes bacterium]|jgi:SAM-dependent methyltransferase|nr:Methyltransferase type 11 [Bacteroidota bacterium]